MKTFKEKLRAIYHIIVDKEYIVVTTKTKNKIKKVGCAIIYDDISQITVAAGVEYLQRKLETNTRTATENESKIIKQLEKAVIYLEDFNKDVGNRTTSMFIDNVKREYGFKTEEQNEKR